MNKKNIITQIATLSRQLSIKVYIVGGYVRDLIMGHLTKNEIDFVVVGDGVLFANEAKKHLLGKNFVVYKRYGTARFSIGSFTLEFVGARSEIYKENSRKPVVQKANLHSDLRRRDFTINAIAIPISSPSILNKIDPFNGYQDIQKRILKTPTDPNITFCDDPLRILRAVRFATRFSFEITSITKKSIIKNVKRLNIISKERIRDEFCQIVEHKNVVLGLELLENLGILKVIEPIFSKNIKKIIQYFQEIELKKLNRNERFGVFSIVSNLEPFSIDKIFRALKFSNKEIKEIQNFVIYKYYLEQAINSKKNIPEFLYKTGTKYKKYLSFYHAIGILLNYHDFLKECETFDVKGDYSNFKLKTNGFEIVELLQISQGPKVGKIIHNVTYQILQGTLKNTKEEIEKYLSQNRNIYQNID